MTGAAHRAAMVASFAIGDIHGHVDRARVLLRDEGLIDDDGNWAGDEARLIFLGDYADRGPDGVGAIDLVRRLQSQNVRVTALLGNHDAFLMAARKEAEGRLPNRSFYDLWLSNGGRQRDMDRLSEEDMAWLEDLPALKLLPDGTLMQHADTNRYLDYGRDVTSINAGVGGVLHGLDGRQWRRLLETLTDRDRFFDPKQAANYLGQLGARRAVHGHSPIFSRLGVAPEVVAEAHAYADGQVVNIDGGMAWGGPGILFDLNTEFAELPVLRRHGRR